MIWNFLLISSNLFTIKSIQAAKIIFFAINFSKRWSIFGYCRRRYGPSCDSWLVLRFINTVNSCSMSCLECWHVGSRSRKDGLSRWNWWWSSGCRWTHFFDYFILFLFYFDYFFKLLFFNLFQSHLKSLLCSLEFSKQKRKAFIILQPSFWWFDTNTTGNC